MFTDILQPTHLLFVLVIALLVLGPKRLPEVGRALGRGLRDFRNALSTDEIRDQMTFTMSTHTEQASTPTEQAITPPDSTPQPSSTEETSATASPSKPGGSEPERTA